MNKKKEEHTLRYKLKLPKKAKIVFYRNPKEFSYIEEERVNPNHVIILWGLLRKKYCQSKQTYKIKMGKVIIPLILLFNISEILAYIINHFIITDMLFITSIYFMFALFFVYTFMLYPFQHKTLIHPIIAMSKR